MVIVIRTFAKFLFQKKVLNRVETNNFDVDNDRTITWVFFVPYILFELPSNLVLKRLGARNWLSFIVIAWGAVMTGMAFVTDWRQLVACRVLLGVLESGFFPGCVSLYPQHISLFSNSNANFFF